MLFTKLEKFFRVNISRALVVDIRQGNQVGLNRAGLSAKKSQIPFPHEYPIPGVFAMRSIIYRAILQYLAVLITQRLQTRGHILGGVTAKHWHKPIIQVGGEL